MGAELTKITKTEKTLVKYGIFETLINQIDEERTVLAGKKK